MPAMILKPVNSLCNLERMRRSNALRASCTAPAPRLWVSCHADQTRRSGNYQPSLGISVIFIFNRFKNEKGREFKESLARDTKGMLQLYEASFLLTEGEDTLELARQFSRICLQKKLVSEEMDDNQLSWIRHSLDLPLHWRSQALDARWFLDAYAKRPDMSLRNSTSILSKQHINKNSKMSQGGGVIHA
ncbi:hypothetical protein SASPL_148549 [Salvia splendens]|uniref:Terpene synthase N-terminal domain-containing protein n=1 Tax=Salvia splendens TaxID=180675 RepID=A0A8X8WAW0_SALSN|nr:hypothetical protein SASPL_148549 [Salvia splendens]